MKIAVLLLLLWSMGFPWVAPVSAASLIDDVLANAPQLNPNFTLYPASSLLDNSALLDAPAGKHGFVQQKNGRFVFEDGRRARFYGVNLAKETVFVDKATIEHLASLFARTGINLVRIHHIDDTTGILHPDKRGEFHAGRLDLLDYWIAQLKLRGIYLCLDLNDYRTFRHAEGARFGEELGRGAKPYAVFDQRLIELQQQYARQLLLEHVNPYTGLAYAHDPAIALLEIYDENGLFIRRKDWQTLREPYKSELQLQWNAWLRYRYGSTDVLRLAWTNERMRESALMPGENLENASVRLPIMLLDRTLSFSGASPLRASQRVSDGALFAYDTQLNYLQMMRDFLRNLGVKIPITAVGAQDVMPDLMATAEVMDYIGINYYWDHPAFQPGNEWKMPYYFYMSDPFIDNPAYTFPVIVSSSRMHNLPLVVREINYCYPNPHRGIGVIESASYGAMLDVDALITFTYDAGATRNNIGYFDIHLDPLRWGLTAQAARIFHKGKVQPAKQSIGIAYSEVDAFTWALYNSPLHQLAYVTRVENYTNSDKAHPFGLLVSSGRSSGGKFRGAKQLIFANRLHADRHFRTYANGPEVAHGYQLKAGHYGDFPFDFRDIGFARGRISTETSAPSFLADDLTTKGLEPIATKGALAFGFRDRKKQMIGFRQLREELAVRVALDALHLWNKAPALRSELDNGRWKSDTGQIIRDTRQRMLRVETPTLQALAGRFAGSTRTRDCVITTATELGTLQVESLDDKSLAQSAVLHVQMTSKANNSSLSIIPATDGPKPNKLLSLGVMPIVTGGRTAISPTRLEVGGKLLLELFLQDGNWEYLQEGNRALLFVDTGEITVRLPRAPVQVRAHYSREVVDVPVTGAVFTTPGGGALYTEIIWGR